MILIENLSYLTLLYLGGEDPLHPAIYLSEGGGRGRVNMATPGGLVSPDVSTGWAQVHSAGHATQAVKHCCALGSPDLHIAQDQS